MKNLVLSFKSTYNKRNRTETVFFTEKSMKTYSMKFLCSLNDFGLFKQS